MAISQETNRILGGAAAGGAVCLLGVEKAQTDAEATAAIKESTGEIPLPWIVDAATDLVSAIPFDSKAGAVALAFAGLPFVYESFRYRRPVLRVVDSLRNGSGESEDSKPTKRLTTYTKRAAKALGTLGAGYIGYRVGVDASHLTDAVLTVGTLSAGVTAAKIANKR